MVTQEGIETWLRRYLSEKTGLSPQEIDSEASFDSFGLASSALIEMTGDLAVWLGIKFAPTAVYDYPTISSLARFVSQML